MVCFSFLSEYILLRKIFTFKFKQTFGLFKNDAYGRSFYFFYFIYKHNSILEKQKEYKMYDRVMIKNENEFMLMPKEVKTYFEKEHIMYPSVLVFRIVENKIEYGWVVPRYMIENTEKEFIPISANGYIRRRLNEKN